MRACVRVREGGREGERERERERGRERKRERDLGSPARCVDGCSESGIVVIVT